MEQAEKPERGWRGSPDLWLDAGYEALITGGVEAVKVLPLAQRLGLSRTSFYHHFPDREALLAALLARWQAKNTANLIAQTRAYAETIAEAMLNIIDCWLRADLFDSRMEFAVRMWGLTSPDLTRTLADEDEARMDALRAMFARFGFDPTQADTRTRAVYLTQIGYIVLRTDEPLDLRLSRIPAYTETFTGLAPTPAELARFRARHLGTDG
ncbi:MAG: TetR/AcrR family transcriptional regulator [Paracoccaceae bacterium]